MQFTTFFSPAVLNLQSDLIPLDKHFANLQYWQRLRWCFVTSQFIAPRHWYPSCFLIDLLKNPLHPSQLMAPVKLNTDLNEILYIVKFLIYRNVFQMHDPHKPNKTLRCFHPFRALIATYPVIDPCWTKIPKQEMRKLKFLIFFLLICYSYLLIHQHYYERNPTRFFYS